MNSFSFSTLALLLGLLAFASASSHSEAPITARRPNADITDLYAFMDYGNDADNIVFIANTYPLQFPGGGPNYYALSDMHYYQIHVDIDGDCTEDVTFRFMYGSEVGGTFESVPRPVIDLDNCSATTLGEVLDSDARNTGIQLPLSANSVPWNTDGGVEIPLKIAGTPTTVNDAVFNWRQWVTLEILTGPQDTPVDTYNATHSGGTQEIPIPLDYAGEKTFSSYPGGYAAYADEHVIENLDLGGFCSGNTAKIFVGQRAESFHIALGRIFDLVNMVPVNGTGTAQCLEFCDICDKNVASFVISIPKDCITANTVDAGINKATNGVIAVWSTVRELLHDGVDHVPGLQVSRLGNPLVNELVIGLQDKSIYTVVPPSADVTSGDVSTQIVNYVMTPTLPALLETLFGDDFGVVAPTNDQDPLNLCASGAAYCRTDIAVAFVGGIPNVNAQNNYLNLTLPGVCDVLRLNTEVAPTAQADQDPMGPIGALYGRTLDAAGFPNGRRPGDDTVDIALRVMMGALCYLDLGNGAGAEFFCDSSTAPNGLIEFTDGVPIDATMFQDSFPYLNVPNPGATGLSTAAGGMRDDTVCPSDLDDSSSSGAAPLASFWW